MVRKIAIAQKVNSRNANSNASNIALLHPFSLYGDIIKPQAGPVNETTWRRGLKANQKQL
jgi:hypothetical protein